MTLLAARRGLVLLAVAACAAGCLGERGYYDHETLHGLTPEMKALYGRPEEEVYGVLGEPVSRSTHPFDEPDPARYGPDEILRLRSKMLHKVLQFRDAAVKINANGDVMAISPTARDRIW